MLSTTSSVATMGWVRLFVFVHISAVGVSTIQATLHVGSWANCPFVLDSGMLWSTVLSTMWQYVPASSDKHSINLCYLRLGTVNARTCLDIHRGLRADVVPGSLALTGVNRPDQDFKNLAGFMTIC